MSDTQPKTKLDRGRDEALPSRLSDSEALMWTLEKDPRLNPNGASISFFDQPIDPERFRRQLRYGISKMPRLYQRVVPGVGRLTTPMWSVDPAFDFDYHVRHIDLGGKATEREVLDLAARIYQEPLDRTRPLWRFVAINGLADGGCAVYTLIHHVVADGIGQLRISELYLQVERDEELPPEVDLEALIESQAAKRDDDDDNLAKELVETAVGTVGQLAGEQLKLGRRMLGEVMLWPTDPGRAVTKLSQLATVSAGTVDQLADLASNDTGGSPLWSGRSRKRHLEHARVDMDAFKAASKRLDASINDLFVAGMTEAAQRYHAERDVEVEVFNTSIVVSTRKDGSRGGNAFTPVPIRVPAAAPDLETRLAGVRAATERAIGSARSGVGLQSMSGLLNLLPTSLLADRAREQGAGIDLATSNLRGFPLAVYCAGAQLTKTVIMGPLAGTAMNVTAISIDGNFEIGMFIDPKAITEPEVYRNHVQAVFDEMTADPAGEKKSSKKKKAAGKKKAGGKKSAGKSSSGKAKE